MEGWGARRPFLPLSPSPPPQNGARAVVAERGVSVTGFHRTERENESRTIRLIRVFPLKMRLMIHLLVDHRSTELSVSVSFLGIHSFSLGIVRTADTIDLPSPGVSPFKSVMNVRRSGAVRCLWRDRSRRRSLSLDYRSIENRSFHTRARVYLSDGSPSIFAASRIENQRRSEDTGKKVRGREGGNFLARSEKDRAKLKRRTGRRMRKNKGRRALPLTAGSSGNGE